MNFQKQLKNFVFNEKNLLFISGMLTSLFFLTVTLYFTTANYTSLYGIVLILFEVFPCAIFIAFLFDGFKYELDDFFLLLLNVALIQALFSISTFFSPDFKSMIIDNFYQRFSFDIDSMSYWIQHRVFGFSSGMMFAMPVLQGFMAVVALLFAIFKSLWYVAYIPFLVFSAMVNARIGIIVFFIGFLTIILSIGSFIPIGRFPKIAAIATFSLLFGWLLVSVVESQSQITAEWILQAMTQVYDFLHGDSYGYFEVLTEMFFLPSISDVFTGTGQDHYLTPFSSGELTDIGYVNDLFLGGLFYVCTFYLSIFILFSSGFCRNSWHHRLIPILMIITILLANIKGYAFRQNDFCNLFILISVFLYIQKIKRK